MGKTLTTLSIQKILQAVRIWDDGYIVTNGPTFSPDGAPLYPTQSNTREVYAFDLTKDGTLSNKRIFIQFSKADGYPDGMTPNYFKG